MRQIHIDKKIPIPGARKSAPRGRPAKYPWKQMRVGDSFLHPVKTTTNLPYVAARAASLANGRKFIARKTPKGVRIWRTA